MSAHINDPKIPKKIIESKKIHVILKARSCYDNKLNVILKSIKIVKKIKIFFLI
jgi:hypothetical protein